MTNHTRVSKQLTFNIVLVSKLKFLCASKKKSVVVLNGKLESLETTEGKLTYDEK